MQDTISPTYEREILPGDISLDRKLAQHELDCVCLRLPLDPLGIEHLGKDGVLRSLTADRKVLGAQPLNPRLIKAYLDRLDYNAETEAAYRGVDGTVVPTEQLLNPPSGILPPPLESEQLEATKKFMKESGISFEIESGESRKGLLECPVEVVSDYKL